MKGQIDVDLILSYILFIFFVGFIVAYINDLITPFADTNDYYTYEKKILTIREEIYKEFFHIQDIFSTCNKSFKDAEGISIKNYLVGIPIPSNITNNNKQFSNKGNIYFETYDHLINITLGSNNAKDNVNASLMLIFPGENFVNYTLENNESDDVIKVYRNELGIITANISFTFTNDTDKIILKSDTNPTIVAFKYLEFNKSNMFIGDVPILIKCSNGKSNTDKYSFDTYVVLTSDKYKLPSKLTIDMWLK